VIEIPEEFHSHLCFFQDCKKKNQFQNKKLLRTLRQFFIKQPADVNFVNPDFLLFFESVNKSKQTEVFFVDSNL